ncbi:hypothetical protein ACL00X_11095 [Aeromonas diversa]|uniref:hypothetical protein n=1 Tax=Aeromonas diversa TaxID=502790 RepID=UPI0039A1DA7E
MFYIIESKYVGPNPYETQNVDADVIEISTTPAMTNSSHEERLHGWCGTTNDTAIYAHGEYATLEEACAAVIDIFGDVRVHDANGDTFEPSGDDVVKAYKAGKYIPMSSEDTADWCYEGIKADITAETTDEQIAKLVAEYEAEANSNGYTLDSDLDGFMQERRQELRDELDDEA